MKKRMLVPGSEKRMLSNAKVTGKLDPKKAIRNRGAIAYSVLGGGHPRFAFSSQCISQHLAYFDG